MWFPSDRKKNIQVIHKVGETQNGSKLKTNNADEKNTTPNDSMNDPVLFDQSSSYTTGTESALTNNDGAQTTLLGEWNSLYMIIYLLV